MRCNNGYVKGISIHVANSSLQIWMKIKQMFIYLPDKDVMAQDRFPRSSFPYSAALDQTSFDDLSVGWTAWFLEDDAGQGGRGYGGRWGGGRGWGQGHACPKYFGHLSVGWMVGVRKWSRGGWEVPALHQAEEVHLHPLYAPWRPSLHLSYSTAYTTLYIPSIFSWHPCINTL